MIKWTEISKNPSEWRYETLSAELSLSGVDNQFEFTKISSDEEFVSAVELAKNNFSQIRLGIDLSDRAVEVFPDLPADLLRFKAIDALVPEVGGWWPRCFYFEGFTRALVRDFKNLDLSAAVFIMGATWKTRVIVAALTRAGFNKIYLSDTDEARGQKMIKELARLNFGVSFQFVVRSMVTQLPGTCSVGISVLSLVENPELIADLSYLNFLRPDGVWIETEPYPTESPLTVEALSLGTQVEPTLHLVSNVDEVWAERCFGVKIDLKRYRDSLVRQLKNRS